MSSGEISKIGNSVTKSGRVVSIFSVPCPKCNGERIVKRHNHAVNHVDKLCKRCSNKNNNPQGDYKGIRITWWKKYEFGAKYRNIEWNLDIDDAIYLLNNQQWKCALSNLDLICSGDFLAITASLDRIDNSKGYTVDNVQFVHKNINMMRGSLDMNRFLELCALVNNKVKW